jgi:molybdenum cofactor biosynthesis protein MoaC
MNTPRHLHTARAEATLRLDDGPHDQVQDRLHNKLDNSPVLHTARVSGVMAAKRGGDVLPYTDHAEMTSVDVTFEWQDDNLRVVATCEGFTRGGLGARALLAASVCAVTIVDMLPEHAEHLVVDQARIIEQKGGLAGLSYSFDPPLQAAILVVSDAVKGGQKEDRAGAIVKGEVESLAPHGVSLVDYEIVGDEASTIERAIEHWIADGIELILTVGGTGLAHTDITIEAVESMLERPIPGLMEAARAHGQELTPVAFMSRGVAGLVGDTLVVTLPGSRGGAAESCEALFPAVLHVFKTLRKSRRLLV